MSSSLSDTVRLQISMAVPGTTRDGIGVSASEIQVRFVPLDSPSAAPVDWANLPSSAEIDPNRCTVVVAGRCDSIYRIELRSVTLLGEPIFARWVLSAVATHASAWSDPPPLRLVAVPSPAAGSVGLMAIQGWAIGLLIGVLVLLLSGLAPRGRRLAVAEFVGGGVVLVASAIVLIGIAILGLPLVVAGTVLAAEGIALLAVQLAFSPRMSQPRLVGVLIGLAGPATTALIVMTGAFRASDIVAAVASSAAWIAMAPLLLAPTVRQFFRSLDIARARTWLVVVVAFAEIGLLFYWAALIATGETSINVGSALLIDACCVMTAIALWFWLRENSWPMIAMGVALPVGALLLFGSSVMAALSFMYSERASEPYFLVESLAVIAIGGIILAICGALPPRATRASSTP